MYKSCPTPKFGDLKMDHHQTKHLGVVPHNKLLAFTTADCKDIKALDCGVHTQAKLFCQAQPRI